MTKLSIAVLSQEDRDLLSELKGVVSRHVPDADVYQLQLEQEVVFSVSVVASDEWEQPIMMNCYTSWNFTQATCSAVMNTNQ